MTTRKVLIVDDNPVVLPMITDMVRELGYATISVGTGEAALEELSAGGIDVLLSDIALGTGLSGIELIARGRVGMPQTVVLMSGNPEPDGLPEGTRYLGKPFTMRALERALPGWLSNGDCLAAG